MFKYFMAALLLFIPTQSLAREAPEEGWTLAGSNSSGKFWIRDKDWHQGRSTSRNVKVWVWYEPANDPSVTHIMNLFRIDCKQENYQILQGITYNGTEVEDQWTTPTGWQYPAPNSVAEMLVAFTCVDPAPQSSAPAVDDFRNL